MTKPATVVSVSIDIFNALLLSYIFSEIVLRRRSIRTLKWPAAAFAVPNICATFYYLFGGDQIGDAATEIKREFWIVATWVKVPLILSAFFLLTFFDVRRDRKLSFRQFLSEVWTAFRLILPVAPCLVIGFSFLFFMLTTIPRYLGAPPRLIDNMIYYGQFYGPFSILYLMLKRQFLMQADMLPTHLPVEPTNDPPVNVPWYIGFAYE